jgi:TolB-like protein
LELAAYASPEQFAWLGTDIRSDLYSLGVTLWEMLSGKPPFRGSAAELMDQHQHAALPLAKLRDIPGPIMALLEVLLAKDPSQRFQTPARLLQALTKVRGAIASGLKLKPDELKPADEPAAAESLKAKPKKQPIRRLLGAGLCLAIALIAWLFFPGHLGLFSQRSTKTEPTEKSIAVLPFENISPNKEDAYFADGVQDEILNNLAKVAQLKVISRTSVMQYRLEAKRNLRQIAADLGVANALEGTVRRDGNHVRVSTELVDASNDSTIWADSYDRDLTDIFTIQSEIAQTVALKLTAQLSPEERNEIEEKLTNNLEAYDLYLQAKQLINSVVMPSSESETYLEAIALLDEATQKDDKFALAYCLAAKAHDYLYYDEIDHTPERRALGDAAVSKALRLRPDLAEAHLAAARHFYRGYRDFDKARAEIAIAAKAALDNPDVFHLTALIDKHQGHWQTATAGLERATTLDPRNPDLLHDLEFNYFILRRYRDSRRILDRLIELEPDEPVLQIEKAEQLFDETGNLKDIRALCEALPPSLRDASGMIRAYFAMCAREFGAAEKILNQSNNYEIFFYRAMFPPRIWVLWLELVQGNHPSSEQFGAARDELYRKVEANPTDPFLMSALALADVALGRMEEGIREGQRAMEMRRISDDAEDGPAIATNVALVYVWANQADLAFEQLNILVQMPNWHLTYGDLKTDPGWDPLRKDPRFEKLLTASTAELRG